MSKVPNRWPRKDTGPRRIAIVGESPDKKEVEQGEPFAGPSGWRLEKALAQAGLDLSACWIGNVCQVRPPGDKINKFDWNGPEIQEGLVQLRNDLTKFDPHFVILLGGTALKAFRMDVKASIGNWRGSLFMSDFLGKPKKCMATWHPAATIRDESLGPVMRFDLIKGVRESKTDDIKVRERRIWVDMSKADLIENLRAMREEAMVVSVDIEGGVNGVSCIGFAWSPTEALVVPFEHTDGTPYWSEADEVDLWQAVADVLEDPSVPKILQNYLYDSFVLAWSYGILIRGLKDDTMLKFFELYCELEKSLAFQCSILTDQPFYKGDRKATEDAVFYRYCGLDCCLTYECNEVIDKRLLPGSRKHDEFNLSLLPTALFMELRGIRYDRETARKELRRLRRWQYVLQDILNRAAGRGLPEGEADLVRLVAQKLCRKNPKIKQTLTKTRIYKNGRTKTTEKTVLVPYTLGTLEDCRQFAKDSCQDAMRDVQKLVAQGLHRPHVRGQLSRLLGVHLKIDSTGANKDGTQRDANWFLYEHCGFPKQFKKEGNAYTDRLTSDDDAVLAIYLETQDKRAKAFLKLRSISTQIETLEAKTDEDGRVRCGLNIVGTETDRFACYKSPTSSGFNLQTAAARMKHLFLADEGCLLANCDLTGADGWTIAAYSRMLGDSTMFDDLKAELKPAQICVLMHDRGAGVNQLSRDELRPLCSVITEKTRWEYFAFKRVVYGRSYLMGNITQSAQILSDSYKKNDKPIYVAPTDCGKMGELFFIRYDGIRRWHKWMEREIKEKGCLTASNGFRRVFYGRKDSKKTVGDALAHLPQVYTTYATKLAMRQLWYDPENRREDGGLIVEPLLTVHDSLLMMFPEARREWATRKIRQWFSNTVVIAGQEIMIPFAGGMGPNWGQTKEPL